MSRRFPLAVLLAVTAAWPFSNFSYLSDLGGEIVQAGARGTALGNTDAGLGDSVYAPLSNPAGLGFLKRTLINIKFIPEFDRLIKTTGGTTSQFTMYDQDLPYFRLCIPLGRAGAMSLGYQAQNSQNFSTLIIQPNYNHRLDSVAVSSEGIIYNLAFSYAYRMGPVSVGAKILQNSGKITHRDDLVSLANNELYAVDSVHTIGHNTSFTGTHFEAGTALNLNWLNLGAAASLPYGLEGIRVFHNFAAGVDSDYAIDTNIYDFHMPLKFRAGGRLRLRENLGLAAEGAFDLWGKSEGSTSPRFPTVLRNGYSVGGGLEYIPTLDRRRFYLLHIPYRAGGYFSRWSYGGVREMGLTFGVGLPLGSHAGALDLAGEMGKRTSPDFAQLTEKYLRFSVEISQYSVWGKVLYKKKKKQKPAPGQPVPEPERPPVELPPEQ
jgi:hypothetical protein